MGWRDAQSKVNAGAYKPKADPVGEFATGFASVFVPTFTKIQEEKRTAERKKIEDAAARSAAAAKEAAAQEKQDKKDKQAADLIYSGLGGNIANTSDAEYRQILTLVQVSGGAAALDHFTKLWGTETPLANLTGNTNVTEPPAKVPTTNQQTEEAFDANGVSVPPLSTSPRPKIRPDDLSIPENAQAPNAVVTPTAETNTQEPVNLLKGAGKKVDLNDFNGKTSREILDWISFNETKYKPEEIEKVNAYVKIVTEREDDDVWWKDPRKLGELNVLQLTTAYDMAKTGDERRAIDVVLTRQEDLAAEIKPSAIAELTNLTELGTFEALYSEQIDKQNLRSKFEQVKTNLEFAQAAEDLKQTQSPEKLAQITFMQSTEYKEAEDKSSLLADWQKEWNKSVKADANMYELTESNLRILVANTPSTDPNYEAYKKSLDSLTSANMQLSDETYSVSITEDGVTTKIEAKRTSDGNWYNTSSGEIIPNANGSKAVDIASIDAASQQIARIGSTVLMPVLTIKKNARTLLTLGQQMDELVTANPQILTFVGGQGAALFGKAVANIKAIGAYVTDSATTDSAISTAASEAATAAVAAENGLPEQLADSYSRWYALSLKFAYIHAAVALDQKGAQVSNYDFENSLNVTMAGKGVTYSTNLKTMINDALKIGANTIQDYSEAPDIRNLMRGSSYDEVFRDTFAPLNDYLEKRGYQAQLNWLSSAAPIVEPPAAPTPVQQTPSDILNTLQANTEQLSKFKAAFQNAEDKNSLLTAFAKRLKLPPEYVATLRSIIEGQ